MALSLVDSVKMGLVVMQVLSHLSLVSGCSASKHPHFLKKTPKLFVYSENVTKSEELCVQQLKGRVSKSCQAVNVNFHSFLAKSLAIPVTPSAEVTNSVSQETRVITLIKRMELGLQKALHDSAPPSTAQISYSSPDTLHNVVFVLKPGHQVFGAVATQGSSFSLEPCLSDQRGVRGGHLGLKPPACHLWIERDRKSQNV